MKHPRGGDADVSLALSLSLGGGAAERKAKLARRGEAGAGGEFVCKTCRRGFASFQALGGHRTSHLRDRHGLALGLASPTKKLAAEKPAPASHQCHICGLGFKMGQALGGHMRGHREEAAAAAAAPPPVLLELFV